MPTKFNALDRRSAPLRNEAQRWAREHGLGYAGCWDRGRRLWRYDFARATIAVEVMEDGSRADIHVYGTMVQATTARGLRRVLDRIYRGIDVR